MGDYEIGYRKPPREHQFKKGVCPNPAGRGKGKGLEIGAVTRAVLDEKKLVTLGGRKIRLSRWEIWIHRCVASALKGDVESAAALLKLRSVAMKSPELEPLIIDVVGGLPR